MLNALVHATHFSSEKLIQKDGSNKNIKEIMENTLKEIFTY